jgi:hypothetical protein
MGRVFVSGLSQVEVGSAGEALATMRRGARQRRRGQTGLNATSSRSHSIFTVRGGSGVRVGGVAGSNLPALLGCVGLVVLCSNSARHVPQFDNQQPTL